MHWPVEGEECLDCLVKCKEYKEQRTRWRTREKRHKEVREAFVSGNNLGLSCTELSTA